MSRAKLIIAAVILFLAAFFPVAKSEADYCGETCTSCVEHDDGGITCCYWVNGHFQGCDTIH